MLKVEELMAEKKEAKKKNKRPTAEKRMIQNVKGRDANRAFKSQVRTAVRRFKESLTQEDTAASRQRLDTVYSLVDKGVKKGVFKLNKASRIKSRLTANLAAK